MVRSLSDRLRRFELLLLAVGALAAGILLALNASEDFRHLAASSAPRVLASVYGMKLVLMEAALLVPYLVLALLSRALLRETQRHRYRWAGLGISLAASAGVVAMLLSGRVRLRLDEAVETLVGSVVPALVLLSLCALLYGGLIWLAQHGALERLTPAPERASRSRHRD